MEGNFSNYLVEETADLDCQYNAGATSPSASMPATPAPTTPAPVSAPQYASLVLLTLQRYQQIKMKRDLLRLHHIMRMVFLILFMIHFIRLEKKSHTVEGQKTAEKDQTTERGRPPEKIIGERRRTKTKKKEAKTTFCLCKSKGRNS